MCYAQGFMQEIISFVELKLESFFTLFWLSSLMNIARYMGFIVDGVKPARTYNFQLSMIATNDK